MIASFETPAHRWARAAAMASAVVAVGLLVLGCGGSAGGSAAAASIPPGAIALSASEYKFAPATTTAMPGSATFVLTNAGATEHELRIFKGDTAVGAVAPVAPGKSGQVTVTLEPGDYTYVCKVAAHDQLGMKGTLTVAAS